MTAVRLTGMFSAACLIVALLQSCYYPEYEYHQAAEPRHPSGMNDRVLEYEPLAREKASQYQVDYYLMMALIKVESGGNTDAISPSDCRGLTQLKLETARDYAPRVSKRDLHDPEINLDIAGRHMRTLRGLVRQHFPDADLEERVLLNAAAWNAGWGAVRRAGGIPGYDETQRMTRRVLGYYRLYRWGEIAYTY